MLQYTEDNNLINHALCQYMFVFVTRMDFSYKKKKKSELYHMISQVCATSEAKIIIWLKCQKAQLFITVIYLNRMNTAREERKLIRGVKQSRYVTFLQQSTPVLHH